MDQVGNLSSGVKKFDGTEFEVWSTLMEAVLTARNLWYVIEDEIPDARAAPAIAKTEKDEKWKKDDKSARAYILLSLEHEMVKLVLSCPTSKEVWSRLKSVHSQKSESCRMVLYQEFYASIMEPGQRISDYVSKVEFIAQKLRNAGASLDDETLISKIVTGLSSDYKHFMTTWMGTSTAERTYQNLLPRLLAEESISNSCVKLEATAMKMRAIDDKARKTNLECFHCHKKGHLQRDCRKLKAEQEKLKSEQDKGSTDRDSDSEKSTTNYRKTRFATVAKTGGAANTNWFIDSGASYHMSANLSWFRNYRELREKIPIRVGNNETLYAIGTGSIEAVSRVGSESLDITLTNVMYVPGISDNLYSQGAADAKGVEFLSSRGIINIISRGKTFMIGRKTTGSNMYVLDIQVPARACVAREERTKEEWHRVLGHPDINEISNMDKQGCTVGFKISEHSTEVVRCSECQQGKAHRCSHPSSRRERAGDVLERVHVDLVGPVLPTSLGGKKYFMLCRDECSTYLNVYFMGAKSQTEFMLKEFFNQASAATQRRVKILRSDNGTEFTGTGTKLLCHAEGIVQEFSTPYTAEQNGEIERANRSVIESARTMLAASGLPLSLWGEAIRTAVYLKNLITNKRNHDKTPYEIFHGRAPMYSHLLEFGKEMHTLVQPKGKFQGKTIETFMVGYGDRINIYRCFDPSKNDVIITSDTWPAPHTSTGSQHSNVGRQYATFLINNEIDEPAGSSLPSTDEHNSPDNQTNQHGNSTVNTPIDLEEVPVEIARERCSLAPSLPNIEYADIRHPTEVENPSGNSRRWENLYPTNQARDIGRSVVTERASGSERATSSPELPRRSSSLLSPDKTAKATVNPSDIRSPHEPLATSSRQGQFVIHWPDQINLSRREPRGPTVHATGESRQTNMPIAGQSRQVGATGPLSPRRLLNRLGPIITNTFGNKSNIDSNERRNLSAIAIHMNDEPQCYTEALNGSYANKWKDAIATEFAAHKSNGTWELVPKPPNVDEITSKWIFKMKDDLLFKARLVARGFVQQAGVDYKEIFAPVVRMDSIRFLFSLCAQYGLKYKQFDITAAFLHGNIEEELYLKPPEGLEVPTGYTCRLRKSLYGLKQAPRCWNATFSEALGKIGLQQTYADPCVYTTKDEPALYLALYVDDGLIFSKDEDRIRKTLEHIEKQFVAKRVNSSCFLGLEIVKNHDGSIFLHQRRYIERVVNKYNLQDAKGKITPIEVGHNLNRKETLDQPIAQNVPYPEAVGSLLYCAVATRPDISHAVSVLSKYTSEPRQAHWVAVKRVISYLNTFKNHGLLYKRVAQPRIICYTDADYAGDHENRRSISGMVTFLASGPITYRAQQQTFVALSTTEAEYCAASLATRDLIWLQCFAKELKVRLKNKASLLCDNQSALRLIKNPEFHQRSKHIDIIYHFVRDKYQEGCFEPEYVPTEDQLADVFTKALTKERFTELRKLMGCIAPQRLDL